MTYSDQVTDVLIQAWPFSKNQWFIRWNVIWLLKFFWCSIFYLFLGPRFEAYGVDGGSFSETNFCQRPYLSHKFHLNQLWLRDLPIRRWPKVCYMFIFWIYRVSHSKDEKVILLWWGHRFWFLLICWVLRVHEIGSFMPNLSVFIFFFDVVRPL